MLRIFSTQEDQMLIDLVKENPELYAVKSRRFKDHEVKNQIWKKIAQEINKTEIECRARWKSMRDYYLRRIKEALNEAGEVDEDIAKKLPYQLDFLTTVKMKNSENKDQNQESYEESKSTSNLSEDSIMNLDSMNEEAENSELSDEEENSKLSEVENLDLSEKEENLNSFEEEKNSKLHVEEKNTKICKENSTLSEEKSENSELFEKEGENLELSKEEKDSKAEEESKISKEEKNSKAHKEKGEKLKLSTGKGGQNSKTSEADENIPSSKEENSISKENEDSTSFKKDENLTSNKEDLKSSKGRVLKPRKAKNPKLSKETKLLTAKKPLKLSKEKETKLPAKRTLKLPNEKPTKLSKEKDQKLPAKKIAKSSKENKKMPAKKNLKLPKVKILRLRKEENSKSLRGGESSTSLKKGESSSSLKKGESSSSLKKGESSKLSKEKKSSKSSKENIKSSEASGNSRPIKGILKPNEGGRPLRKVRNLEVPEEKEISLLRLKKGNLKEPKKEILDSSETEEIILFDVVKPKEEIKEEPEEEEEIIEVPKQEKMEFEIIYDELSNIKNKSRRINIQKLQSDNNNYTRSAPSTSYNLKRSYPTTSKNQQDISYLSTKRTRSSTLQEVDRSNKVSTIDNATSLFFKSIAETICSFPSELKAQAKIMVLQLISDLEKDAVQMANVQD